jgi:phosphonate transport system substrate-binding protein
MHHLRLVSMMAANADPFYRALTGWLSRRGALNVEIEDRQPWRQRQRMLDRGEAHIGFLCGLAYVRRVDGLGPPLELIAAPVMEGRRYAVRAVYFSDVIVHRDRESRSFEDLRDATWSYNEPGSHSGYTLPLCYLGRRGESNGYFRRAVQSGSHQHSLWHVASGRVDAAAIDSVVLERELALGSAAAASVRVIETLGPSPAPPAVVHASVPAAVRATLRELLTTMRDDAVGRRILRMAGVSHFVPVSDRDYDPIRQTAALAAQVRWCPTPRAKKPTARTLLAAG